MALGLSKAYTPSSGDIANSSSYNTDIAALFNAFTGLEAQTSTLGALTITPSADGATKFRVTDSTGNSVIAVNTSDDCLVFFGTPAGVPAANAIYKDNVCKGWINLDGTGIIAINDSFNVSGIVDDATGQWTITWNRDFATATYACATTSGGSTVSFIQSMAVGSVALWNIARGSDTYTDIDPVCLMAFGDQ